ncbi:hypothetical protein ACGFRB_29225 [Streptomyces sp. NPDC048718]|uniref:hypothetical protein n=1 Tax=Streptomyces sp. NPDC048718 TaxID=3365587 RepID=UPI00371BB249
MRWPWQRAERISDCPHQRLLPSATAGVPFDAAFVIGWRPAWRTGSNLEDLVRFRVHEVATEAAGRCEAADPHAAQDAVNAVLRDLHGTTGGAYRILHARVTLRLSAESRQAVAQSRADEDRVRRLRFLKAQLYDHPDLLVLDRLEQRPGTLADEHVAELQRLARSIRACGSWWQPLLEQWEDVGRGFNDADRQQRAMVALLDALRAFTGRSASLPTEDGPPSPLMVPGGSERVASR